MAGGVVISLLEIKRGWFDKLLAYLFADENLQRLRKFVWPDDSCNDQSLEQGDIFPLSWPFFCERIYTVVNMGPFSSVFFETFNQCTESINCFLQLTNCAPYFFGNPVELGWDWLRRLNPGTTDHHKPNLSRSNLFLRQ